MNRGKLSSSHKVCYKSYLSLKNVDGDDDDEVNLEPL